MTIQLSSEQTTANSYLIIEDGFALLIDVTDSQKISRLLDAEGWVPELIILTHEHVDHICGLEDIRTSYSVPVIASSSCNNGIQNSRTNLSAVYDMLIYAYSSAVPESRHDPFCCRPCEITFDNEFFLQWRTHRLLLHSCPGHSPGSSIIIMDHSSLFTGDYLLPGTPPVLDLPGGNADIFQTSTLPWLRDFLNPGCLIFPGHGDTYVFCEDRDHIFSGYAADPELLRPAGTPVYS